jgi:hypothetical protein
VTEIRYSFYAADQKRQQLNKVRQIGYFINTMIHRVDTCAVRDSNLARFVGLLTFLTLVTTPKCQTQLLLSIFLREEVNIQAIN